ncbi:MAG: hypothetical protein Kow0098_05120 [Ignavibacteriaceae bacterium]
MCFYSTKIFTVIFLVFFVTINITAQEVSEEEIRIAIDNIARLLEKNYVFESVASDCGKHLKEYFEEGGFEQIITYSEFAETLTAELQKVSKDKHMRVTVEERGMNNVRMMDPILENYLFQQRMKNDNFGIAEVKHLEGNIGYLDIRFFPPVQVAGKYFGAAMKLLSNSDALIIDLRKNSGGNPDLIRNILSYFFDQPVHLNSIYRRAEDKTEEFWTLEKVDGKKMPDVPVFVLTSSYTFSGGEEFAYDLQSRERATIIGEVTGGGANPGETFPVNNQLNIFIPTGRAVNPVTNANWEGTGVHPDILADQEDAFKVALEMALIAAEKHKKEKQENVSEIISDIRNKLSKADDLLFEKNISKAEKVIFEALKYGLDNNILDEMLINIIGYEFLGQEKALMAKIIFQFNVKAFPESWNVYDSLAEAYMNLGEKQEAISYYEKSLELNPENQNGKNMLKKLKEE